MKIAITGARGLIGSRLTERLLQNNAEVLHISRGCKSKEVADLRAGDTKVGLKDVAKVRCLSWGALETDWEELEGLTALVHLAGETINQRWTKQAKQRIRQSRVETTILLSEIVKRLHNKPEVVINGSAIGVYGSDPEFVFDETSEVYGPSKGGKDDFLAQVVKDWEAAADEYESTRVVKLRTGVVLDAKQGALPKMVLPYKLGIGGPIGSGKQWLSWIHIDDMVRIIEFCIHNKLEGAVNAVSPQPVRNEDFGKSIASVLRRPHYLPLPSFVLRVGLGEMSSLLLEGQRVTPARLMEHGFQFEYDTLEKALKNLLA